MHNHHNFAWREEHFGRTYWVVRKGCTPARPGQEGFVGGSMGDDVGDPRGRRGRRPSESLYSTVHGAGRVMSRTKAAGRVRRRKRYACSHRDCDRIFDLDGVSSTAGVPKKGVCPDHPTSRLRKVWVDEQISRGLVDWAAVQARLREQGIVAGRRRRGRGAGGVQAPAGGARRARRLDPGEAHASPAGRGDGRPRRGRPVQGLKARRPSGPSVVKVKPREQPLVDVADAPLEAIVRWPSSAVSRASAPGMCSASQTPWANGTNLSCSPCHTSIGTRIDARSKPHGVDEDEVVVEPAVRARHDPGPDAARARTRRGRRRAPRGRPARGSSCHASTRPLGCRARAARPSSSSCWARCASSPSRMASNDSTFSSPIPAVKSSPSASYGRDRGDRRGRRDAVRQERRRRERVRPAARDAPDAEPLDPERVADRGDVGGAVGDAPPRLPRRAAVPGPVVGEQPDPALRRVATMRLVEQARVRRPAVDEHRNTGRIAALPHRDRAPVGRRHGDRRLRHGGSLRRRAGTRMPAQNRAENRLLQREMAWHRTAE